MMKTMKNILIPTTLFILYTGMLVAQDSLQTSPTRFPRHFFSVNPLNILLFQQAGITYEYKPGRLGFGLTAGYIYPNHKEYSNYFIAGPTNAGSLGDYTGYFVVPQVNFYFNNPKKSGYANLVYFSLKPVYKFMQIDSSQLTSWSHPDDYYVYRKMIDKVNVYGGFVGVGYKCYIHHFFLGLELGFGILAVDHKMAVSAEWISYTTQHYLHPPKEESTHESHLTVNFTLALGGAF